MENEEINTSENPVSETKKSSIVYIVSFLLLVLVVGIGFHFMTKSNTAGANSQVQGASTAASSRPQRPSFKGQKLSDTQFADNAYQIYPGTISESAKAAMSGWDLKTTQNADGTITASLIPSGSEAAEGDSSHTYTLKPTDKLYFADLNPGDDKPGAEDANARDDIGIVVDANGIIQ